MSKKMNAFTLIELLAVIVILAIISLIATPIILGIVEDAKKDAFLRSVELVISTTDMDITSKTYEKEYTYDIVEGNISNLEIGIKNTEGMNGNITYDLEGKEEYAIHNGVYCVKKTNTMNRPEISDYQGTCSLMTSEKCFELSKYVKNIITNYYDYEDNDSNNKGCPRDVRIPETIEGNTITSITDSAFNKKNITSVKFPNTLQNIGNSAFAYNALNGELDLSYLTNLKGIGKEAFYENDITSIKLPNSITSIENSAFQYNKISGELDLSNTNLTSIGGLAFSGKSDGTSNQITSVKFPNSVQSIGNSAFAYNALNGELDLSYLINLTSISGFDYNQITSVKFPNDVTSIGGFSYNKISGELDLSHLTNLISIDGGAFQGKSDGTSNQITSVKFPNSVQSIGNSAFQYNKLSGELDLSYLTNLTIVSGFEYNQITSVKFPNNVTSIAGFTDNKLSGELDLSHLTNLTNIGNYAFHGNDNSQYLYNQITSIKLPNSIKKIGSESFYKNKISGELDLSMCTNLTSIGMEAFYRNNLTSLKLPNLLTNIGKSAFNINKLTSVTFYGRSDLTGVTVGSSAWGWASGYNADNNIYFVNE